MSRKIKIGIIGAGGYGRTATSYFANTGEYEIKAFMDISADTANAQVKQYGGKAFTELELFLEEADIEAVSINTPVLKHAEHAGLCLEHDKHVFLTKPVTAVVEDAEALVVLAEEKGLVFMVGHHARFAPEFMLAKDIMESGQLGRVCNVVVMSCSSGGLTQKAGDWRTIPGQNPGGPLLQCGIHSIDTLLSWFGKIKRLSSFMQDNITEFEVVDNAMVMFEFENGVQATLISNYTTAYYHTVDILGTKAALHIRKHITGMGQTEVYLQKREEGLFEPWEQLRIPYTGDYPDFHGGILEREFARQIRNSVPDYSNLEDAVNALRLVHSAVASDADNSEQCVVLL